MYSLWVPGQIFHVGCSHFANADSQACCNHLFEPCKVSDELHSQADTAGPTFSHYSRPLPQDTRINWRALGFPKMAFVTIIFLCLALFLLVFSAGRMHAQKILRANPLAPLGASPLAMSVSIPGMLPGEAFITSQRRHSAWFK